MSNMYEGKSVKQEMLDLSGNVLSLIKINVLHNLGGVESYQPLYIDSKYRKFIVGRKAKRSSLERYDYLASKIMENLPKGGMYLDIGSQYGYLPLRVAEEGYWCCGVEIQSSAASIARELANLNGIQTAFISNMNLVDGIEFLPSFDVVSMLSVFHHIISGIDDRERALELLHKITDKVKKRIIVEIADGLKEEFSWSKSNIEFCEGLEAERWFVSYFETNGFSIVDVIEYSTHLNSVRKTIVLDRIV